MNLICVSSTVVATHVYINVHETMKDDPLDDTFEMRRLRRRHVYCLNVHYTRRELHDDILY